MQFFEIDCDCSTHDFHQKADRHLLQKGVKTARKTVTLETKMLVIRRMEAGMKRANVCSSFGLEPAPVSTVMVNAEK
jgi:hypothetical protein